MLVKKYTAFQCTIKKKIYQSQSSMRAQTVKCKNSLCAVMVQKVLSGLQSMVIESICNSNVD